MEIQTVKWRCEIHGIYCSVGRPCYECKREIEKPEIIEKSEIAQNQTTRERNSKPRIRI